MTENRNQFAGKAVLTLPCQVFKLLSLSSID